MRVQLKYGATRIALVLGNLVFKFPNITNWKMFLNGLLGNMQEAQWCGLSEKLCPVYLAMPGGFLNIMPYARPVPDEDWAVYDRRTFDKFRRCKDGTFLPAEFKQHSVGYLPHPQGGEYMVIVDYGS